MRAFRVFIFLITLNAALYFGRFHLVDLSRTLGTYIAFRSQLASHPEELYRYGISNSTDRSSWLVPPIIHYISLNEGRHVLAPNHKPSSPSCERLHGDWEHMPWTDESASAFMQQYYPQLWPHYKSYRRTVQRANLLRYALLDHFGGIYLDLDLTCLQPLNDMMHLPWLAPAAHPSGVSNGFMMSRPNHPFMKQVLAGAPASDLSWGLPYVETMLSTGCMFLSNQLMRYTRAWSHEGVSLLPEDKVYVLADEHGNTRPHMLNGHTATPLFQHAGASSWHKWDAALFLLIGDHYPYFLGVFVVGVIGSIAMLSWYQIRKPAHRDYGYVSQREKAAVRSSESEHWLV